MEDKGEFNSFGAPEALGDVASLCSNGLLEMAVHEWSRLRESDLNRDEIFKLLRGRENGRQCTSELCCKTSMRQWN